MQIRNGIDLFRNGRPAKAPIKVGANRGVAGIAGNLADMIDMSRQGAQGYRLAPIRELDVLKAVRRFADSGLLEL